MRVTALMLLLVGSAAIAFTVALVGSAKALGLFRAGESLRALRPRSRP
jgi:hypothetical protein